MIPPEHELRFEAKETDKFTVVLLEGSAEIYGVEMKPREPYTFSDRNIAIFTWYGCKIEETTGSWRFVEPSSDTNMTAIVNSNSLLEAQRDVALRNGDKGPRVRYYFFSLFVH